MDMKYEALARDKYRCQKCGKIIADVTSQADHIKPVKQFASFAQAHKLSNIQTLCVDCHEAKSYAK
jgi:5-methylcytosine-specific restriction endonuclease McrA